MAAKVVLRTQRGRVSGPVRAAPKEAVSQQVLQGRKWGRLKTGNPDRGFSKCGMLVELETN